METKMHTGLSQKFLSEAISHQDLSARAEEQASCIVRVYNHLMAMALERGTPSATYDEMVTAINELTTPDTYSRLRLTQPNAAQALLSLKAAAGQFEQAYNPAPEAFSI